MIHTLNAPAIEAKPSLGLFSPLATIAGCGMLLEVRLFLQDQANMQLNMIIRCKQLRPQTRLQALRYALISLALVLLYSGSLPVQAASCPPGQILRSGVCLRDDRTIRVVTAANVASVRAQLLRYVFGSNALP